MEPPTKFPRDSLKDTPLIKPTTHTLRVGDYYQHNDWSCGVVTSVEPGKGITYLSSMDGGKTWTERTAQGEGYVDMYRPRENEISDEQVEEATQALIQLIREEQERNAYTHTERSYPSS